MVGRTGKVTAGAMVAEGRVAAGTVVPGGCVAARAVETAVETAVVAGARGCWAAGATEVARLAEVGDCWAAGTGGGCRECAHSWDICVL